MRVRRRDIPLFATFGLLALALAVILVPVALLSAGLPLLLDDAIRHSVRSTSNETNAPITLAMTPPTTLFDMSVCYRALISHSRARRV